MSDNMKFFMTDDLKAFLERHQIPMENFKVSSDGVGSFKAQAGSKVELIKEMLSTDVSEACKDKLTGLIQGYLENIEDAKHIKIEVELEMKSQDAAVVARVRLDTNRGGKSGWLSYNIQDTNPKNSQKLSKLFPLASLFLEKDSPFYDEKIVRKFFWVHVCEQLMPQLKRNAEHGKNIRALAKELIKEHKPEPDSLVDLLLDGEEKVIAMIKKYVNVARPIEIDITRHNIKLDWKSGYQVVINFSAAGKSAAYILTALRDGHSYKELYAVVVGEKSSKSMEKEYITEKWLCSSFPGRSEEEFMNILSKWGLREAKSSTEKKFSELSGLSSDFKVEAKDEGFCMTCEKHWELTRIGRGDQFEMRGNDRSTIEESLQNAAKIAKGAGMKLTAHYSFDEIDYYGGCSTHWVPSFSVVNNEFRTRDRDSNSTPKGWMADVSISLELPKKFDIKKVKEIVAALDTATRKMN